MAVRSASVVEQRVESSPRSVARQRGDRRAAFGARDRGDWGEAIGGLAVLVGGQRWAACGQNARRVLVLPSAAVVDRPPPAARAKESTGGLTEPAGSVDRRCEEGGSDSSQTNRGVSRYGPFCGPPRPTAKNHNPPAPITHRPSLST